MKNIIYNKNLTIVLRTFVIVFFIFLRTNSYVNVEILANSNSLTNESINKEKSVVILFDVSGSMNTNDRERLGIDSVMEFINTLPSYYKVGVIAYANDIMLNTGLIPVVNKSEIQKELNNLKYDGYSNATLGVQEAIKLLPNDGENHIVMITDGEILLESENQTKMANTMLEVEINNAKDRGIKIHYIGLADENLIDGELSNIAVQTGGEKYYALGGKDIRTAIDDILINKLGIKRISLGIVNTNEVQKDIKINLPDDDKLNMVIRSDKSIDNLETNFKAKDVSQIIGKRYAAIQIDNPASSEMNIAIKSTGNEISVFMIPETVITIQPSLTYQDSINEDGKMCDREVSIEIDILNENGNSIVKLLKDSEIGIVINNKLVQVSRKQDKNTLEEKLVFKKSVEKEEECIVTIDTEKMPINISKVNTGKILLEKSLINPTTAPLEETESKDTDYNTVSFISSVLVIAGTICIVVMVIGRNRDKNTSVECETQYSYTGRLDIHIKRTAREIDLPSLTFNLFVISDSRDITLDYILKQLKVEEVFLGAEDIKFLPAENKQIKLVNDSNCTILNAGRVVLKSAQIGLSHRSNIDIYFEDESSHIELEYRQ